MQINDVTILENHPSKINPQFYVACKYTMKWTTKAPNESTKLGSLFYHPSFLCYLEVEGSTSKESLCSCRGLLSSLNVLLVPRNGLGGVEPTEAFLCLWVNKIDPETFHYWKSCSGSMQALLIVVRNLQNDAVM